MNNPESIFDNPLFKDEHYNLVNSFTGADMTVDTLFFSPSQQTEYITSQNGDSCLFFLEGKGKCFLNNTSESTINVTRGSIVYIPKGVDFRIKNENNHMIAIKSESVIHN